MGALRVLSGSNEAFADRVQAGKLLAAQLGEYQGADAVVVGIPRGGVIVAREIAEVLNADLDIVLTHKLGAPANPELAIGAVCEDGKVFVNHSIAFYAGVAETYIEHETERQLYEMKRRVAQCRKVLDKTNLCGRTVIVTDDGVATGATMQAALWAIRQEKAKKIIAALPVGPADTVQELSYDADETICLRTPGYFGALGSFYLDFSQVQDAELINILRAERIRREGQ